MTAASQHGHDPGDDFSGRFIPGVEPIEHVVVHARTLDAVGLARGLDYLVVLHAMFLMEEWQQWRARADHSRKPESEPACDGHAVWRRLRDRQAVDDNGRPVTQQDVTAAFRRVAAAAVVRGLRLAPGGEA